MALMLTGALLLGAGLMLMVYGGDSDTAVDEEGLRPPVSQEQSGDSEVERHDPKAWFAENCPAKLMKPKGGDDLFIEQAAVFYGPRMQEVDQPRVWRYDPLDSSATPVRTADETFVFCHKDSAIVGMVEVQYQGDTKKLVPISSPLHPEQAGYYVDAPNFTFFTWAQQLDDQYPARVVENSLTPITSETKVAATRLSKDGPVDSGD